MILLSEYMRAAERLAAKRKGQPTAAMIEVDHLEFAVAVAINRERALPWISRGWRVC